MNINLQDAYLAQLKKENRAAVIFLVNGYQLKGHIIGYDNFTVFLETAERKIQLIYKHAITTISPQENMLPTFMSETFKELQAKKAQKISYTTNEKTNETEESVVQSQ